MKLNRIVPIAISLAYLCSSPARADDANASGDGESPTAIYDQISKLVREFYEKATISSTDKGIQFKHKVRKEVGFYSKKTEEVPTSGGIAGDVTSFAGLYSGKDKERLPFEEHSGFHTTLVMAPYSIKRDSHLLARLSFPEDMPIEFKQRFKEIINGFASKEQPKAKAEVEPVQTTASSGAEKQQKTSAEPSSNVLGENVQLGPLQSERRALLSSLFGAREQGVGIAAYAAEFNRIEELVKSGQDQATIESKVKSLADLLKKQMEIAGVSILSGDVSGCKLVVAISTDDSEQGSSLGTHSWWGENDNSVHVRAQLLKGVRYYLHVRLDPPSNDRVFLGTFKLSGTAKFASNNSNVIESRPGWWRVSLTGFGRDYRTPVIAPGKSSYVVQCPVLNKINPDLMPLMDPEGGTGHDGHVYFSTVIQPE